jgi:hypothetical protein
MRVAQGNCDTSLLRHVSFLIKFQEDSVTDTLEMPYKTQ